MFTKMWKVACILPVLLKYSMKLITKLPKLVFNCHQLLHKLSSHASRAETCVAGASAFKVPCSVPFRTAALSIMGLGLVLVVELGSVLVLFFA